VTTLEDIHGGRKDANFTVEVALSGSALSNDEAGSVTLDILQGSVEFPVTDEVIEEVDVSVQSITPLPPQLDTSAVFNLGFAKKVPAIVQAAFSTAHDHMNPDIVFTYNETIENSGVADPLSVKLDGEIIPGNTVVSDNQMVFTAEVPVVLNRCYEFDTAESSWVGAAEQDPVLIQQGMVCSPHAAIPLQDPDFAVEERSLMLELVFGEGMDRAAITDGKIVVHGIETGFDWTDGTFVMPAFSSRGLQDGSRVNLALSGRYQNENLLVANTISIRVLLKDGDLDEDGLPNGLEMVLGLNPTLADSDEDGVPDGDEDSDGDGITNAVELAQGTDPNNPDTGAPQVAAILPTDGADGVALLPQVLVTFSEPVRPTTITADSFVVSHQGQAVSGRYVMADGDSRLIWQAEEGLKILSEYAVTLNDTVRDVAGNRLVPFSAAFTPTNLAIVQPADSAPVTEGQPVTIKVSGSNPAGINAVTYAVNGEAVGQAPSPDFELSYPVPLLSELAGDTLTIDAAVLIGGLNLAPAASLSASAATDDFAFTPQRAADGNPDPDINHGSVAVVRGDNLAFWQADLGRTARIVHINIHLMDGCCYESNRFVVLVANAPFVESDFESGSLPANYSNDAVEIYRTGLDHDTGVVNIDQLLTGRYVRIVNLADDFLALAEVEIVEETITIQIPEIQVQVIGQ
jgi:hypothetical protein